MPFFIKYLRISLSLICFFLISGKIISQSSDALVQIPTIIPPSPTAQAFMRYGEIPVNYSTGVPNISIPLYTVKGKKLELPISISYHASGIKVNDIASEVGLGWVLNGGGLVSRTIMGKPDEKRIPNKTFKNAQKLLDSVQVAAFVPYNYSCSCLKGMYDLEYWFSQQYGFENEDSESDRFYFNLPNGISGVFRYDYLLEEERIIILPYQPLKVEKIHNITNPSWDTKIIGFRITDQNGVSYKFEPFIQYTPQYYSEWHLSEIISPDRLDTIKIDYYQQTQNSSIPLKSYMLAEDINDEGNINCIPSVERYSYLISSISPSPTFHFPVIKSIKSSSAEVHFTYIKDRLDFNGLNRLKDISVYKANSTELVQIISFEHKYFGTISENRRLGLESVSFSSSEGSLLSKYEFKYNSRELPPYPDKMASPRFNEDYWGYYNGSNSPSPIPKDFITKSFDKTSYGANRDPDPTGFYSTACMLNEIIYPTGGRTVFNFERNRGYNVFPTKSNYNNYVGGFRVSSIINYNELNEVTGIKTYEYSGSVTKQIQSNLFRIYQRYITTNGTQGSSTCNMSYSRYTVLSNPVLPLEVAPGLPIMYTKITEYQGTKLNNSGKTIYEYKCPYSPSDFLLNPEHPIEFEADWYYHSYHYDKGNYTPELQSKTDYIFDGASYKPISKTVNIYSTLFTKDYQTGIKLTRFTIYDNPAYFNFAPIFLGNPIFNVNALSEEFIRSFIAIDTKAYQEASLLTKQLSYSFDPVDSTRFLLTTTDYSYNETNLGVKEESVINSMGDILKTVYKYPFEYSSTVYANMVNKNIVSPVIEQLVSKNSNPIKSVKTNYSFWKNDVSSYPVASGYLEIEKDVANSSSLGFNLLKSAQIHINLNLTLCNGHFMLRIFGPTQYQKFYYGNGTGNGNGVCNGYSTKNYQETVSLSPGDYTIELIFLAAPGYPNAGFYGVASFSGSSEDSKPSSYVTSVPTNKIYPSSIEVKEGNNPSEAKLIFQSYDVDGNILSVSKADDIKEIYIWSYNGSYPVAKVVNADYSLVESLLGGWVAIRNFNIKREPTVNEITTFFTPLINYASNPANKVFITTYTYDPLIGMTSQTDPNGITTYYEYDGFGRLKHIKDQEGNILQKFDYHYKESSGN